jgi:hypothetical protein
VIVVVGSPTARSGSSGVRAGGLPAAVAREIVVAGQTVQLVGKLGEGPDGDAVALSLAADGIGHVALQRIPAPVAVGIGAASGADEGSLDTLAGLGTTDDGAAETAAGADPTIGAPLEAADLELALRYLPDYRVVVLAQSLDEAALAAARDAARWAGAHVIELTAPGTDMTTLDDATVLEAPAEDAEGAFASLVGRYAAALDAGTPPAEAFAAASAGVGWAAVSD